MSLILALPTKQRVRETVVCTAVASAVSAIACVSTTASTTQAVGQPSASSARVVNHNTPLQVVVATSAASLRLINQTAVCQSVAAPLSPASATANYSVIATAVAQPSARYALIDATGEVGVCSTVASISATSNRIVSHYTPVETVATASAVYRVAAGSTSTVNAVADVTSRVSRQVNHAPLVQAVAKPFIEQGVIRYVTVIRTVAIHEATFEVSEAVAFDVTTRDYSFKTEVAVPLEIDPADKNIKIDPDQKSFYV